MEGTLKKFMNEYKHLQQFYKTKKEFKQHLLSDVIKEPKQEETLEEFIEKEGYPKGVTQEIWEQGVREGAKWQKEQYTIEEQCVGHNIDELDKEYIKGFNEGSAYQQERMYSEEDMKNAFDSAREFNSLDGVVDVHIVLPMGGDMSDLQPLHFTFDEWFNEFKNK